MLPLSSIISSPLARAVETADYLVQGRALTVQREPDLMDIELGHWSGQNRDALFHTDPAWEAFVRDPTVSPSDVETFPELEQRAVTAIERWLKQDATGPLPAFVTHADVIKVLLAHYLGLEAGRARSLRSTMHPSVSLQSKLTGHRSCLPSAGIPNLDGYIRPPLPPSKRAVKGTQRGQTFNSESKQLVQVLPELFRNVQPCSHMSKVLGQPE